MKARKHNGNITNSGTGSTGKRNHFKTSATKKVTRYQVITKKAKCDVIAGRASGLKNGRPSKAEEVKIINVQKFIMMNLPESKLKNLIDLLYHIAMHDPYCSEAAKLKAAETLLAYGIGKPKETLQLAMPPPAITIQHNVINTSREELAESGKMKLNVEDME